MLSFSTNFGSIATIKQPFGFLFRFPLNGPVTTTQLFKPVLPTCLDN